MENRNWFVHVEWVIVLVTLLGGFYTLDTKIENRTSEMRTDLSNQCARIDRLYEMFYELFKEGKK